MNTLHRKRNQFIFTCLLVPILLLLMFVVYPSLDLIRMSFTDWDGLSLKQNYIGARNYITMLLQSPDLWLSLKNNFVYFFVHLCAIPLELMAAVMLNTKFRGAKFFRSMTFLPYIINGVAIAYAFSYFYSPINGAFNAVLTEIGLGGAIHNWLSDEGIVNYVLASVSLWKYSGYHVIMFIAALQSIPQDIMEAATVDGANAWQKFKAIQIPSIQLVIDFILFDNVRGALQIFDIPFVMTNGGPGYASSTFTLYTINTAFKYNNFGLAATMAVTIMILIILVYSVQSLFIKFVRRGGH
ncbi:sugar ABC transporter permease [Anaerocolumna sp. AGMB13025]|uniref:carbohydrate ABC transporter permease n=1 Tax=Anaerocolumna sp. AGMB13025 TaxID=3039116 RepID=UPI00241E8686|nr:sugar ABC transporter permease [Anaerocolumna sp. AGMB13025]WFR58928.1 sugar ABC transporter permease [Anaerocolumna sp. AGMB13025]